MKELMRGLGLSGLAASEFERDGPDRMARAGVLPSTPRVRLTLWLAGMSVASIQAWAYRHLVNPDSISYLDIAQNCVRGNWHSLINGYWSPLYPFLLSVVFRLLKPSPYWESTIAHFTNVGVFMFAFAAFEFLVANLIRAQRLDSASGGNRKPLDEGALWAVCDSIFVCYTLVFGVAGTINPDLCMASLLFLAAALLVRIRAADCSYGTYAAFGGVLALSYMAKAVMFPLSFVFLACCFLARKPLNRHVLRTALALLCFVVVAGPFIWALSHAKRRITFGDTGKIAYAEYVNGATILVDWQGGPGGDGHPIHSTRQLLVDPPLFEFSTPVGGTYPPWYDPSYWYDGIKVVFRLGSQLRAMRYTIQEYVGILAYMGVPLIGFAVLAFSYESCSRLLLDILAEWPLLLPAVAGLGAYALVHVEPRLVLPFLLITCLSLFAALHLEDASDRLVVAPRVATSILAVLCIGVVWTGARSLFRASAPQPFVDWEVAAGLRRMGIRPGDHIASISNSFTAYWAHLAGVRIIADILPGDDDTYWASPPPIQSEALADFAKAGAKMVVADQAPPPALQSGWRRIGQTDFFVYQLPPRKNSMSPDDLDRH